MNPEILREQRERERRERGRSPSPGIDSTPAGLLRILLREEAAGRRKTRDSLALSLEERVEAGDCVAGLRVEGDDGARIVLRADENLSRFREGDPATLGDGHDLAPGLSVRLVDFDPVAGRLTVERDYFSRGMPLEGSDPFALDRREISTADKLARALERALADRAPAGAVPVRILAGGPMPAPPAGALAEARAEARARDLDPSQQEAFASALLADPVHLIQGPPGSGKTRLLADLLRAFVARGERVLVTAFTHLAINNVLRAFCARGAPPPCPVLKIGRPAQNPDLADLPVSVRARLRNGAGPPGPCVIGATVYGAIDLWGAVRFDRTVIDEAAQVPLPHGVIALGSARRATLVGDHQQMGPIVRADPPDALAGESIFAHLHRVYGSSLLRKTYRMNEAINAFVSRHFYDGKLTSDASCARRRLALRPGGRFRPILDGRRPAVLVLLDHEGCRQRAPAEAALAADLLLELLLHHRLPPEELAVISPYRAQVNAIRQALRERASAAGAILSQEPVIDTVERMQGQERDVVIVSFTNSDPEYLLRDASFFYSPNRLNVLLSRPRVKRILLASPLAFRAIPRDLETLRHASLFRRIHDESERIPWPPG
jgi:DNA replication ATP-dependent helicase Dna2